ncbi:MAG: hypothetical protein A2Y62_14040 [Candidatus Fischerbacteria bacterium RBG_13_37_8]|uniref:Electron transfer flavoprotein alpha/beta-subunit N-terminal domain-containing protein n=1 Tax=Candidatus Fischerbacteria bacterium RBG_13_37_8 TaxID=1817863 RepID=A0A1F5VFL1_9BACT|nr:MAG: hypothetical protein A2Y62_14040 [Candidatus Fischerbacteria bacterium RBG_13_37_8]
MELIICIKQVPDTAAKIKIGSNGKSIDLTDVDLVVSPFDEYAVEEALRIKEAKGGKTTVITFGPERASQALRQCLAMGIDDAIHVKCDEFETSDSLVTASILAAAIKTLPFDMVLFGKQGVGRDNAQVPAMVAELLNLPQVVVVTKFELISENKALAQYEVEGGVAVNEIMLPAVISAEKGLNEPRYPTLKGIMASKKKPIKEMTINDLGFTLEQVGEAGSKVVFRKLMPPPARPEGKVITGEPKEAVAQLIDLLRNEAKLL